MVLIATDDNVETMEYKIGSKKNSMATTRKKERDNQTHNDDGGTTNKRAKKDVEEGIWNYGDLYTM